MVQGGQGNRVEQSGGICNQRGDPGAALECFRRSEELYVGLVRAKPTDDDLKLGLASLGRTQAMHRLSFPTCLQRRASAIRQ
jgi:hypothetical protein